MPLGKFEVDTANLRATVGDLKQYFHFLKQMHAELRDKMTELSGMWDGPAKEAFHLQFQNDCTTFAELCKQIDEAIDCMDNAVKEYDSCDNRVKSMIDANFV